MTEPSGGPPADPTEFPAAPVPDSAARDAAREALRSRSQPLGRLAVLAEWLAGVQGRFPVALPRRVRLVVFAGDHGIAPIVLAGEGASTAETVARLLSGAAPMCRLAEPAGVALRVVDVTLAEPCPALGRGQRVRAATGRIDRGDALTVEEVRAAVAAGRAVADEEIDGGADLLVVGAVGVGGSVPTAALVALLTHAEPHTVLGRGGLPDDAAWVRAAGAVRDACRRGRPHAWDPGRLLATVGGGELAGLAGFLAQAAARRTPVVLDGPVTTAAALVADRMCFGARSWWLAGQRSADPAHVQGLEALRLDPVLDLGVGSDDGAGALLAVGLLPALVALVGGDER